MSVAAGLLAAAVLAVAAPAPSVEVRDVSGEKPPAVNVVLRVSDDQGNPVAGLDAKSFDVFEDGTRVPEVAVRQSHPDELPIAVSILLDTSGSMRPEDLEGAKTGARAVLATLTPEDVSEIVSFDSEVKVVDPFDSEAPGSLTALQRLRNGNTRLNDALSEAIDRINSVEASKRVIIVLTDGLDEKSLTPADAVTNKVEGAGVTVHSIALGDRFDPGFVRHLSEVSGGTFRQTADPGQLKGLYSSIASSLLTEYRLSYQSTAAAGKHELTIVARTPKGTASTGVDLQLGPTPEAKTDDDSGTSAVPMLLAGLLGLLAVVGVIAAVLIGRRSRSVPPTAIPVAQPVPLSASGSLTSYHLLGPFGAFPIAGTATLGRDPSAAIVVDDDTVSRAHARLSEQVGGVLVEDLGSSNGTTINGVPITQQLAQPGDRVAFGDVQLELRAPTR